MDHQDRQKRLLLIYFAHGARVGPLSGCGAFDEVDTSLFGNDGLVVGGSDPKGGVDLGKVVADVGGIIRLVGGIPGAAPGFAQGAAVGGIP